MFKKALITSLLMATTGVTMAAPNIAVYATGGTIAGQAKSASQTNYTSAKVGVNQLVQAVPALANIANITSEQVAQIGSQDMSDEVWLKLAKKINAECGKQDGFVITHGTDTMEETAYFLHLTAKCNKPIVLVGAMRPSNGLSADGPANLYNAVAVATDPSAKGRGVMVAMNERVLSARDVTKTSTTAVETFQSPNAGQLATIHNGKVYWDAVSPTKHTTATPFNVDKLNQLPKVGIVYQHAGVEGIQAQALVDAKYAGIVTAGVGNGNLHKSTFPVVEKAAKDGIVVVRSSRVPTGSTTKDAEVDDAKYGFVSSGSLNPQKARVLLMLSLTQTKDPKAIQKNFDQY
ncbi:MAG: L-asparaginase 2 [Burkholderiaceae bacterium]|nr:L-asparaginase 2 [Burkholderiaceae bacterium]